MFNRDHLRSAIEVAAHKARHDHHHWGIVDCGDLRVIVDFTTPRPQGRRKPMRTQFYYIVVRAMPDGLAVASASGRRLATIINGIIDVVEREVR